VLLSNKAYRVAVIITALAFVGGGWLKVLSARAFGSSIAIITGNPELHIALLFIVPIVEIALGVFLLLGCYMKTCIRLSMGMLVMFSVFILINMNISAANCGCFGDSIDVGFNLIGLAKNGALLLCFTYMQYYFERRIQSNHKWRSYGV
jgi:uncharacterized membrane protein YphA (DoxX/SURF4 family)